MPSARTSEVPKKACVIGGTLRRNQLGGWRRKRETKGGEQRYACQKSYFHSRTISYDCQQDRKLTQTKSGTLHFASHPAPNLSPTSFSFIPESFVLKLVRALSSVSAILRGKRPIQRANTPPSPSSVPKQRAMRLCENEDRTQPRIDELSEASMAVKGG